MVADTERVKSVNRQLVGLLPDHGNGVDADADACPGGSICPFRRRPPR